MKLRFLAIGLFLSGCSAAVHEVNFDSQRQEAKLLDGVLAKPSNIDFQQVQHFVLQTYCMGCHNTKEHTNGVDVSSYEKILAGNGDRQFVEPYNPLSSSLYTVLMAQGKRHMPPLDKPQLNANQINLVYLWIEHGARPSPGAEVARPPTLKQQLQPYFDHPEMIDYTVVRKHVLGTVCMKCHSLDGDSPDKTAIANSANMTNYSTLFNKFTPIVNKGQPEDSKLFQSIAITQSMPNAKDGYDPLDGFQIRLIRLWILNCAIEDKQALGNETLHPDPNNPEKVRDCN